MTLRVLTRPLSKMRPSESSVAGCETPALGEFRCLSRKCPGVKHGNLRWLGRNSRSLGVSLPATEIPPDEASLTDFHPRG